MLFKSRGLTFNQLLVPKLAYNHGLYTILRSSIFVVVKNHAKSDKKLYL